MKENRNIGNNDRTVGIKEIARRATVAIATVDRVIHNRGGVSKKTKEKVNAIIKDLNYQPNLLARRLASQRIYTIAILIPKVSSETTFRETPLKGIKRAENEISLYGITIKQHFFDLDDVVSFSKQVDFILSDKIDGLLVAPLFVEETLRLVDRCKELMIPYVFIDSDIPDQDNLCYFGPDLTQSGSLAAHLMKYTIFDDNKIL